MKQKINKFLFREFSQCKERFWLRMHGHISDEKPDLMQEFFMEQKKQIENYALELLSSKKNRVVEQQKFVETDHLLAKIDLYEKNLNSGKTAIYEVYNSRGFKSHRLWDLAFMTHALMVAGEPVNKIYAIYLNSNYVQPENGTDISSLIVIEELSSKVKKLIHKVKSNLSEAMEFALKSAEELNPEEHKCNRKDCPALDFLNIKSAENELESAPIVQYDNNPIVKNEALQTWLQKLQYPIYFLDYEALTANIPVYPNTKPFQHVVFQYSLHLILSPEAKPIHFEFLPDDKSNPTEKLLQSLCNNINNDNGSVLVWHDSFEKTRNREMASFFPEFSEKLLDINRRIIDLEKVFNQDGGLYIHPNFDGKSSIKKVFPVLLPSESSYEELEIGDGMMASILWHRYLCNSISEDYPEEKLRSDLLQYCGLDTGAMVKILEFLLGHF